MSKQSFENKTTNMGLGLKSLAKCFIDQLPDKINVSQEVFAKESAAYRKVENDIRDW